MAKAAATASVAIQPATGLPIRLPATHSSANPARGKSGMR